jgi:hypothetical protein
MRAQSIPQVTDVTSEVADHLELINLKLGLETTVVSTKNGKHYHVQQHT